MLKTNSTMAQQIAEAAIRFEADVAMATCPIRRRWS